MGLSVEENFEFKKGLRKQPFSYYGGKQRMASKIIKVIPKHTVYVEPFCGGASVFWRKSWPKVSNNHHYREVLNDFNGDLINFFRVLQKRDSSEELQHRLQFTPYSQDEHLLARKILKREVESTEIDRAWAWFVQTNMSFANKVCSGWGTGVFGPNLATKWATKLNLLPFFERLISTHISNEDAIRCLNRWDSPQTFAYIDPPYIETDCGHYKGYTEDQYRDLIRFLDEEYQGNFILSGYPSEFVPEKWERLEYNTTCSAKARTGYDRSKKADERHQNRKRTEVLWMRENIVPVKKEIQSLYYSGKFDCFPGWSTGEDLISELLLK